METMIATQTVVFVILTASQSPTHAWNRKDNAMVKKAVLEPSYPHQFLSPRAACVANDWCINFLVFVNYSFLVTGFLQQLSLGIFCQVLPPCYSLQRIDWSLYKSISRHSKGLIFLHFYHFSLKPGEIPTRMPQKAVSGLPRHCHKTELKKFMHQCLSSPGHRLHKQFNQNN